MNGENSTDIMIENNFQAGNEELEAIYAHSGLMMMLIDENFRIRRATRSVERLAGFPTEELIGMHLGKVLKCPYYSSDSKGDALIHDCRHCPVHQAVLHTWETGQSFIGEASLPGRRGQDQKWLMFRLSTVLLQQDNNPKIWICFEDLTELRDMERQLQDYHEKINVLIDLNIDGIMIVDQKGIIRFINIAGANMLGRSQSELMGKPFGHPLTAGRSTEIELLSLNGNSVVTEMKTRETKWHGNLALLVTFRDITERKMYERELSENEEKYRKLVNSTPDAIALVDELGNFLTFNPAWAKKFNTTQDALSGKSFYDFLPSHLADKEMEKGKLSLQKGEIVFYEEKQDDMYFHNYYVPIASSGERERFQIISRDMTENKKMEEKLKYMSFYDSLTSLYSRSFFEEEMKRMQDHRNVPVGIIVCDVDGLKIINDTLGHDKGDQVLRETSDILKRCFRSCDVVSRIGGDEFAILLPQTDEETISLCCSRIRKEIKLYNQMQREFCISLSLGYSVEYASPVDMNKLFKSADDAMYKDKLHHSSSSRNAIIQALIKTMEARDYITEGHADRLQDYVHRLGSCLSLSEEKLNELNLLARFHDLGKVGVPDSILFKNGPLSDEEFQEMERHCEIGNRIAHSLSDLAPIANYILKHHEWWNGEGYPLGLQGEDIPLECRILAIADAYDTMTSERPYKQAKSSQDAKEELRRCAGTQFDPELVELFIRVLQDSWNEEP